MRGPRIVDAGLTIFFLGIAIVAVWQVQEFPFQDQLYPYTASVLIVLFVVIYVGYQIISGPIPFEQDQTGDAPKNPLTREQLPTVVPLATAVGLLILAVLVLGHLIAVPGFAFFYMLWRGEKWWVGLIGAALLVAFIWGLLINVMDVALPYPWAAGWLGL